MPGTLLSKQAAAVTVTLCLASPPGNVHTHPSKPLWALSSLNRGQQAARKGQAVSKLCGLDGPCCNYSVLLQTVNNVQMQPCSSTCVCIKSGGGPLASVCHSLVWKFVQGPLLSWCARLRSSLGSQGHQDPQPTPQDTLPC